MTRLRTPVRWMQPCRQQGGSIIDDEKPAGAAHEGREGLQQRIAALEAEREERRHRLAALAHEIANPLGPLTTALHLLPRVPPEKAPQLIEMAERQLRLLSGLVEELRREARAEPAPTAE